MQPASLVKWTKRSVYGLLVHVLAYTLLSAIVLVGYDLWYVWLGFLAITHFLIDRTKYHLSDRLKGYETHLFLADQTLHVIALGIVLFFLKPGTIALSDTSAFIQMITPYKIYLPYIAGYISLTFAVSILVFETDRTYGLRHGATAPRMIVTFKERAQGMIERTVGLTLLLFNNLFFLFPLAFIASILVLYKRWSTNTGWRRTITIEFTVGWFFTLAIASILRLFIFFS
ncbi:MAG: DUF3307 domain-containing protein [Actinobacteria bacterium]|nr:MAG: DUF3307 domain-containing protein [Actinomycetota bacterium]